MIELCYCNIIVIITVKFYSIEFVFEVILLDPGCSFLLAPLYNNCTTLTWTCYSDEVFLYNDFTRANMPWHYMPA